MRSRRGRSARGTLATGVAAGIVAFVLPAASLAGDAAPASPDLNVWRRAVEQGVVNFSLKPLEKLHADTGRPDRDEVAILLARCLFVLGEHKGVARVLGDYEKRFPAGSRFTPHAAYWLARADLEKARAATTAGEGTKLLTSARTGLTSVLNRSVDSGLLEGARYFLGVVLFEEGAYEEALAVFRRARELGVPATEAEALELHIGRAHLELRSFEEAKRVFDRFVSRSRSSPALAEACYGLGEAHYYLEAWSAAAAAYQRSRDDASRRGDPAAATRARYAHGWALMKLGEEHSRKGKTDEARAAWEAALPEFEAFSSHPDHRLKNASAFESGEILYRLGRLEDAARRLRSLTEPVPHPSYGAKALYVFGRSHVKLGNLSVAVGAFRRALEAGAEGDLAQKVRHALADALVEEDEPGDALGALVDLTRSGERPSVRAAARLKMAQLVCRAGELAAGRGETRAAVSYYSDAGNWLGVLARDAEALAELQTGRVAYWRAHAADGLARLKTGTEARQMAEAALKSYAKVREGGGWSEWVQRSLADEAALHVFLGEPDKAVGDSRDLLDHGDLSAEVEIGTRLRLADLELQLGRPAEARRALATFGTDERMSAGRDEAEYKHALAFSRERDGTRDAERGFRELLDRSPDGKWTPFARAGLGECLMASGDCVGAAEQYETVLLDFPAYPERDAVELAAGDARRAAGGLDAAAAHYRSLFRRGRSDDLRARARLAEAGILSDTGRASDALALARDAAATAQAGGITRKAEELRGRLLASLGRYEAAALAFARAGRGAKGESLARVRSSEARSLLQWARSGAPAEPADVLRRTARKFTEAHYLATDAALRDETALDAAGALVELAAAERAKGRPDAEARELREAWRLVDLVSSAREERKRARAREIDDMLRRAGGRR
jgi:TolA-binding protein